MVAFGKTKELKPGESETLVLNFDLNYLASYDETGVTGNKACYVLEEGEYLIFVGDSVSATRNNQNLVYTYKQKELKVTERLSNQLIPPDPDVADANKKPDFNSLISSSLSQKTKKNKKILRNLVKKKLKLKAGEEKTLPTNEFNEINFKSVLEG